MKKWSFQKQVGHHTEVRIVEKRKKEEKMALPVEYGQWPPVDVKHLAGKIERFAPRRPLLFVPCVRVHLP